jgi:hypothetical protein
MNQDNCYHRINSSTGSHLPRFTGGVDLSIRVVSGAIAMGLTLQDIWYRVADAPSQTWHWFMNLNREEWMVTLVLVCAFGFVSLLGFQSRRI